MAGTLTSAHGGVDDNFATRGHLVMDHVIPTLTAHNKGDENTHMTGGGVLVTRTFQKVIRSGQRDADGNLPPEVWEERDIAATINVFDNGGGSSRGPSTQPR